MILSKANSIRFFNRDTNPPNFDNTKYSEEYFKNAIDVPFCQVFFNTDDAVVVQIKTDLTAIAPVAFHTDADNNTLAYVVSKVNDYADFTFWEFTINFSAYTGKFLKFEVNDGRDYFETEYVYITAPDTSYLLLEWFNNDRYGFYENDFEMDYSKGHVGRSRIASQLLDYVPGGSSEVYDNQGTEVKLKEIIKRGFNYRTEPLPRYLAEQLIIAFGHDNFFINQVAYVASDKPDLDGLENTGLVELSVNINQGAVVGINANDEGYNPDSYQNKESMVLSALGVSASFESWTVPDGYLASYFTAYPNAGSSLTVKIGTSAGADDVMPEALLTVDRVFNEDLTQALGYSGDQQLFVTIGGTAVDIDFTLIVFKNTQ